jgi:hypothetical protein
MKTRSRSRHRAVRALFGLVAFLASGSRGGVALAQPADPDGFAKHALRGARGDYRAGRYDEGAERLREALEACANDACSPALSASVLRELGAMEFKRGNEEEAAALFELAKTFAVDLPFSHYDDPRMTALWKHTGSDGGKAAPKPRRTPAPPREPVSRPARRTWFEKPPRIARVWIGVAGALDSSLLPGVDDPCGPPSGRTGAYCTNADGSDFRNDAAHPVVPGSAGSLYGGFGAPDVRVLLQADLAFGHSVLAGVRLGYAFDNYTGRRAPHSLPDFRRNVHAEVRGTYLFGEDPLGRTGFSPMVFAAAGTSDFDAHTTGFVRLTGVAGREPVGVWSVAGPWFVSVGGGARYQFSLRVAFTAALRMNLVFGGVGSLFGGGPELGIAYGF